MKKWHFFAHVKKSRPFSYTKHLLQNGKNSPQQKSLGGAPPEEVGAGEGEKGQGLFWEECQPCGLAFCEENERWGIFSMELTYEPL